MSIEQVFGERGLALAADAEIDAEIDATRLRVAIARLSRRLRRHELAGLTPTQLSALSTVEQAGPLRLGDVAAAEGIAPSTLTRMVTALEEFAYVQRYAVPRDARATTLAITPRGHEALERMRGEYRDADPARVRLARTSGRWPGRFPGSSRWRTRARSLPGRASQCTLRLICSRAAWPADRGTRR